MEIFSAKQKHEIARFIAGRENKNGGYGLVKIIPPDLEDTFYSLQSLKELGINNIGVKTKYYLQNTAKHGPTDSFRISCHLAKLFKDYGLGRLPDQWQAISAPPPERMIEFYYYASFYDIIGDPIRLHTQTREYLLAQTPQSLRYLTEGSRYILVMKRFQFPFNEPVFIRWIQGHQWYDGGFGVIQNSTSFLEHAYIALVALDSMDAAPSDVGKCREFVTRCYRSDGGFGRQSQTVPTPQDTYYAIRSLKILRGMI